MNIRSLLVLLVVLFLATSAFAIQTGKLRVQNKVNKDALDAGIPADATDSVAPVNIVDETVVESEVSSESKKTKHSKVKVAAATSTSTKAKDTPPTHDDANAQTEVSAPRRATHVGKKTRTSKATKSAAKVTSTTGTGASAAPGTPPAKKSSKGAKIDKTNTKNAAKKTGEKKKKIYLRTDGLPEYAAKAKELLAAAEEQSWPGEPLVQGCTPLECTQWCDECGSTTTCENRCFLYSQCNDDC